MNVISGTGVRYNDQAQAQAQVQALGVGRVFPAPLRVVAGGSPRVAPGGWHPMNQPVASLAQSSGIPAGLRADRRKPPQHVVLPSSKPKPEAMDMTHLQWEGLVHGLNQFMLEEMAEPEHATDQSIETAPLYVSRVLTNAEAVIAWARAQGFKTIPASEMHVTVAYSREPLVWPQPEVNDVFVPAAAKRSVEALGDEGCVVLRFESPELTARWRALKKAGASWDHPDYLPHVTFTTDAAGSIDLAAIEPYTGTLEFGPEHFVELKDGDGWAERMRDAIVGDSEFNESDHPRAPDGKFGSGGGGGGGGGTGSSHAGGARQVSENARRQRSEVASKMLAGAAAAALKGPVGFINEKAKKIAGTIRNVKETVDKTAIFLQTAETKDLLATVVGAATSHEARELGVEALSYGIQTLMSHGTGFLHHLGLPVESIQGLDAGTWRMNEDLVDFVVKEFGSIMDWGEHQARDSMKKALDGLIALRQKLPAMGHDEDIDDVTKMLMVIRAALDADTDADHAEDEAELQIDFDHDGPWLSCMSQDGRTMYVNRNLPKTVDVSGVAVTVADPLRHHEQGEWARLQTLLAAFSEQLGREPDTQERKQVYLTAHNEQGTPPERAYCEQAGIDWGKWSAWCRGEEARVEKLTPTNPPPDPDVRPIPHGHGDLEAVGDNDIDLQATDSAFLLALDYNSVREKDRDGRLRVAVTNISKANVCPYLGEEIPGYKDLDLDPKKIYYLLRPAEELERAARSSNGVQVLRKHKPVNAADHQPYDVVGATGTDADFNHPYLRNSIVIWAGDDIADIESGKKKQLSMGYHYKPDMTPGTYQGTHYDGVMRDIAVNHVAIVEDGRAGDDVVVGDDATAITWALIEHAILQLGVSP